MIRSFKRNMWRAESGDGHHMEQTEFHGGSAVTHTQRPALQCHLSQPVSACSNRGCSMSKPQKTCVRPAILSIFIGCAAFRIWMNLVQVWLDLSKETCEEQKAETDIIWNKQNFMEAPRSPHTATSYAMPFISAHVSLQQLCGCTIDLDSLGIRQR